MKVGIELRLKAKDKKVGVLNLRILNNTKRRYKSLKIELPVRYWDKTNQRVKGSYPHAKQLNLELGAHIAKIENNGVGIGSRLKLIPTYEDIINTKIPSTQEGYKSKLRKFKQYLKTIDQENIYLDEVDNDLFLGYRDYLLTRKSNSRRINNNTAQGHFQVLKSFLNTTVGEGLVFYNQDPFRKIKFKKIKTKKEYLPTPQLQKLIKANLNKYDSIARDIFVFQTFSQGARIADMLLLKWKHFSFDNDIASLEYIQSKGKGRIFMYINAMQFSVLDKLLRVYEVDKTVKKHRQLIKDLESELHLLQYKLTNINQPKRIKKDSLLQDLPITSTPNFSQLDFRDFDSKIEAVKGNIVKEKSKILKYKISKVDSNENVFYFNSKLLNAESQYELTKKEYNALGSLRSTINLRLNRISKALNIKHLSTHIARHTFAMLSIQEGFTLDEIGTAFAHTKSDVTRNYVSSLPINQLTKKVESLSDKFI